MNTVLVTGGRYFNDAEELFRFLDVVHDTEGGITEIIVGDARGADALAAEWAFYRSVDCRVFEADWAEWGKGAGPFRNAQMLEEGPDFVVAFPGGAGTEDMVSRALQGGYRVIRYEEQMELEL